MAPPFPRSGPGESGSPTSQVVLRCYDFPSTHPRSLICFASGVHATLHSSCLAACACALGRSEDAFRAGVTVQPATQLPACFHVGRERDLPGSQAIRSVPLPRSRTPAEPTLPRLVTVSSMLPPLPSQRGLQRNGNFGATARLQHLLPTLHEWCCHHPCKARFRLAGSPLPGGRRTLWITTKGFRSLILLFWIYPGAREVS